MQRSALLIPTAFPTVSLQDGAEAVLRRCWFYPVGAVVHGVGCSHRLGCHHPPRVVRLARVPRNVQYIRRSLGTASALSETAGQLVQEKGCLLICAPYSRLVARSLCLIAGLCFSLVYRYSNDILPAMDLSFVVTFF